MAFLHSCYGTQANHAPSAIELMTGIDRPGFPSFGSWLSYGLGTLNENLPSFVVMHGQTKPVGNDSHLGPGLSPQEPQPLVLDARNREEIDNLARVQGVSEVQQRTQLDLLRQLNQAHRDQHPLESDLAARIQSFELAYRMQMAAPEAMDLSQEPEHVREMYGLNWQTHRDVWPAVFVGTPAGRTRRPLRAGLLRPHVAEAFGRPCTVGCAW